MSKKQRTRFAMKRVRYFNIQFFGVLTKQTVESLL